VSRRGFQVAWYRFRTTFARRSGGYLTIVLIAGLIGGLGMAALAGARRTQSSFPTYLASTNPSDLSFLAGLYHSTVLNNHAYNSGYDPNLIRTISHLPHIQSIESYVGLDVAPLAKNGASQGVGTALVEGSVDGEYFNLDRVAVVQGRMANPKHANEVVVSTEFARNFFNNKEKLPLKGITLGAYTNAQVASPLYGTPKIKPHLRIVVEIVGVVKFNDTVLQDDVDAGPLGRVLFTPVLTRELDQCCTMDTASYVKFDRGYSDNAAVEAEIVQHLPKGAAPLFQVWSTIETKTEQAIEPESIALGVFGGIAVLVSFLLVALVISRQLSFGTGEWNTLRAIGANPNMIMADSLFGVIASVTFGSLFALIVAVLSSPLFPLGPVRPFYPSRGFAFDWTVLGFVTALLIFGLGSVAGVLAHRGTRPYAIRRRRQSSSPRSSVAHFATTSGLPASAVTGIRLALEPGAGSSAVPVRSAIVGVAIALTVIVSTLTFGASLNSLASHPALYGWNWNYEFSSSGFGYFDIPQGPVDQLLAKDPYVAAWAGVYFGELQIDGLTEPVIGTSPSTSVGPPILSGHALNKSNQVVLGTATLADLHKRVGDMVEISNGFTAPIRLQIVGTATLPTVGQAGSLHTTMGAGALLSYEVIPVSVRNPFNNPVAGPQAIWVRLRHGVNPTAALRSLRRIVAAPSVSSFGSPSILSVQRPAQIVNYRSMGTTPTLLSSGLAGGAVAALGLTLVASVRRRRRELAILKALGFTQRQLATAVAWQASVAAVTGSIIGVPLGIFLGRLLWNQFAKGIHVVPVPNVPTFSIVLVAIGGLVLANLVAFVPGRIAARAPTAVLLQAE
jgi:hypothetical protein